jgi:predicted MPP superfamily phosphohydrolase
MSLTRMLVFLGLVLSVSAGIHYYLWARLVRDIGWPAPWERVLGWGVLLLALALPLFLLASRALPREVASPISWVVYTWLGLMFLLFVLLIPADLVRGLAWLIERIAGAPADPARRQFLARLFGGIVGAGALGAAGYGIWSVMRPIAVKPVKVPLAGLPDPFAGFVIAQITDVHVGPTIGKSFIEELVAKTNAMEPDLVAITGDLVDGTVERLGPLLEPLSRLKAKHGVYFVTGNHEYFSGAAEWVSHLATLGVRVLRNERVSIERDGAALDLAGIDDPTGGNFLPDHGPDLAGALAGRDASRLLLLLAHQPRQVHEAAEHGVALQLSGHTHGGQIFPFNFLVPLQQPFVAGLHRVRDTAIYVSRGTGYWGPPKRFGAPSEITRIRLVAE